MDILFDSPRTLALSIYQVQRQVDEELQAYNDEQQEKCIRDIVYTLDFLEQAYRVESPQIFFDYIQWLNIVLSERGISTDNLYRHLDAMESVFVSTFPPNVSTNLVSYLAYVRERWSLMTADRLLSHISSFNPLEKEADLYLKLVLGMNRNGALALVQELVARGISVKDIYLQLFQPVQREIGRLWQMNQISVAQEHYATAVTQLAMSQLYPLIFSSDRVGFRLVATSVGNELHEIGIRMVADFFEMAGWDTYYLGANTPIESVIRTIQTQNADVVALSVTLSSQMSRVWDMIRDIRTKADPQVKILVGGYPFNVEPQAWQRVGADGYAPDAESAIQLAYSLVAA